MRIVAKTDKGHVRDSNQDAYAVGEFCDEVVWDVVCDGMGGAAGGNIASALAVKVISDKINVSYREQMRDSSIKNMLDSALNAANVEVFDMSESKHELILLMQATAGHIFSKTEKYFRLQLTTV